MQRSRSPVKWPRLVDVDPLHVDGRAGRQGLHDVYHFAPVTRPGSRPWRPRVPAEAAELIAAESSEGIHAAAEPSEGVPAAELVPAPWATATAEHVREAAEAELTFVATRRLRHISIRFFRISENYLSRMIILFIYYYNFFIIFNFHL